MQASLVGVLLIGLAAWLYWPYFTGTIRAEAISQPRDTAYLEPDNKAWATVLAGIVEKDGKVAYHRINQDLEQLLANYLDQVARATPARFPNDNHRLAFYINAYNALVIQAVHKRMPITSVEDAGPLHAFFRKREHLVAGVRVSLHGFETKVIRQYNPLLHFGLNCASISCPALAGEPYRPETFIQQLESATKLFLANPEHNFYRETTGELVLSKIFEWYANDFGCEIELREFLAKYGPGNWPKDAPITYSEYNWALNTTGEKHP